MLEQIIIMVIYLIAQAFFINGVSIAATGRTEVLPDGSEKDSEMLLYPIYKWLNRQTDYTVFYNGNQLKDFVNKITRAFAPVDISPDNIGWDYIKYNSPDKVTIMKQLIKKIEEVFKVQTEVDEDKYEFSFFIIDERYDVSKYLRLPTLGCIKCMPSIWGTLTYWPFMFLVFPSLDWKILLWILDIVMLIPICYYINKHVNK